MGINEEIKKEAENIRKMRDDQLGKFMIKKFLAVFILWMLKKKEMYGYEIIKTLQNEGMHRATPSNVYPILNNMEKKGYVKVAEKMEGKRRKKYYKASAKGKATLKACKRWFIKGMKKEFFKEMVE
ncbi:MAG: PadR family transcriptional regulator [Candidatus Anstonellales archaeon]